jgi:hypothetical protein
MNPVMCSWNDLVLMRAHAHPSIPSRRSHTSQLLEPDMIPPRHHHIPYCAILRDQHTYCIIPIGVSWAYIPRFGNYIRFAVCIVAYRIPKAAHAYHSWAAILHNVLSPGPFFLWRLFVFPVG